MQALHAVFKDAGGSWPRSDAAVNCGNCLCAWAELAATAADRVQLLCDAILCYDAALKQEVECEV